MVTISVLINSFNYGQYIVEAVESVLRQTRRPDQIIVVDDGSTDGTAGKVEQTFRATPGFELVVQPNRGQLAAIVAGFQRATGDVIFLLDADDRYQPDHVARVMKAYEERKDVDFVFTGMTEFGARSEQRLYHSKDHYFASSVIRSLNASEWLGEATSALSCRRWVLDSLRPVLSDLAPQWKIRADDCIIRGASAAGARKLFLAHTTVDYRVHGANSFASKSLDLTQHRRHWIRTYCFMNRVNNHLGLTPEMVRHAHLEFAQIPHPRRADYDSYWKLVRGDSELSLPTKLRMWRQMKRHLSHAGTA